MPANKTAILSSIMLAFLQILTKENEFCQRLGQLTNLVKAEHHFNTIVLIRHDDMLGKDKENSYHTDQILEALMRSTATPVMSFKGNSSYFLWPEFNRRILAVADLRGNLTGDQQLLAVLWRTLRRNALTQLILLAQADVSEVYIQNILNYCQTNKALNVVFIKRSLQAGMLLYSFQAFPKFEMMSAELKENQSVSLFTDKVKNMHGHPISFVMSKFSNKVFTIRRDNKTSLYGGFVGHFLIEFARKHNATLKFPNYNDVDDINIGVMEALVENGTYDVSAELFVDLFFYELAYSAIYDHMDWCMMVPMEKAIPAYRFYVIIFDVVTLVMIFLAFVLFSLTLAATYIIQHEQFVSLELLFNIYVLNGLLGQTFRAEPRFSGIRSFLFMLICLSGLVFNTSYVSYLQTLITTSPKVRAISSMADVHTSGLKIALYVEQYEMLKDYQANTELEAYIKIFYSFAEFYNLRKNFDSRYIYPVSTSLWSVFDQQQKILSSPHFRLTDICILKMFGMQFPLQSNSPYIDAFNTLIGQVNEAGLVSYWKSQTFYEYIQITEFSLRNKTAVPLFEPMKLEDMRLLVFVFVSLMVLLCACFAFELFWPHRGKFLEKLMHAMKFSKRSLTK